MAVKFKSDEDVSNKGADVDVKLISYGMGEDYKVLIPQIDGISFTYDIPPDDRAVVLDSMLHWMGLGAHLKSAPAYRSRYKSVFVFTFLGNGATVRIDIDPKSKVTPIPFMRFEFNPAVLGPKGVVCFREHLYETLVDKCPWEALAQGCRVTRLDIAIDLLGVQVKDLIVATQNKKFAYKRRAYFSASGALETLYPVFRKEGVLAPLCVYNKAQELSDTGASPIYGSLPHTRIEARLNGQNLHGKALTALHKIKNPFLGLGVIDPTGSISPPETMHAWSYFLDSCRVRGKEEALKMLPTNELRVAYDKAFAEADRNLWKPEKIWKHWPKVLQSSGLLPEQAGLS